MDAILLEPPGLDHEISRATAQEFWRSKRDKKGSWI
jgi:hypothetical protein